MRPVSDEHKLLVAEIVEIQHELETSSLKAFLEPILALDLTMQQLKVLTILVTEPDGGTGQGVSKSLGVSLATVSGIIDRLEAHGMVDRVIDPDDQRVRRLIATEAGRRTIQELLTADTRMSQTPLLRLEVDDLKALVRGLRAILHAQAGTSH